MIKYLFVISMLAWQTDPMKISKINAVKKEARNAFQSGDYAKAIERFNFLRDSMQVNDDEVLLNLANAQYLSKDTANAMTHYQSLTQSTDGKIASRAHQQLGIIANRQGKADMSLSHFKQSLREDPMNEMARYNYEMVKKKLQQQKEQEEKEQNKDKKDQDKKNQEPSEFAKRLKEQADKLVAQRRYREAYALMMDGLKKDPTVSSYEKYIERIKDVNEINQ